MPALNLRRAYAWTVSIALCLVVLSPVRNHLPGPLHKKVADSFPLSTFAMFARARPALEPATYIVALEADGTRHFVHYSRWATGGWNQGRAQVHRYKSGKAGGPKALCELVAGKVAKDRSGWSSRAVEVRMEWGEYDPQRWFTEGYKEPVNSKTLASCPVVRPS